MVFCCFQVVEHPTVDNDTLNNLDILQMSLD